jgi:hypothetical protein
VARLLGKAAVAVGELVEPPRWSAACWRGEVEACREPLVGLAQDDGARLRHSQSFYLSRIMGTSVAWIDKTYGHLVPDSDAYLRGLLDDFHDRAARAGSESRRPDPL